MDLLFADAHLHANPVNGLGAREIARRFKKKNGWFMALVALSPWHYGLGRRRGFEAYKEAIGIHLSECRAAREEGMVVSCFAGFHPADVDKLASTGMGLEEVMVVGERVIEYVANLCREGVLDGIGEVGRQHYKTMPIHTSIAEYIMLLALQYAKDYDCLVHLHLENHGRATVEVTYRFLKVIGTSSRNVFFHHSSIKVVQAAIEKGFRATLPGKKQLLEAARRELSGPVYVVESDFIDDPRRPCVSECPWNIVDYYGELLAKGVITEEYLYRINVDNIASFYRVNPP